MRAARRTFLAVLGCASLAVPAGAQRLTDDWLVRTGAGPGALQPGATAAFWNPAGVAEQRSRASLLVLELLAPAGTGLDVLAFSAGWRLDERNTVAAGFQHLGIGDIFATETSPEGATPLDVSQDLFALSAARRLNSRLVVGAGAQYLHSAGLHEADQLGVGAGARLLAPIPVPLTLAGYAYSVRERVTWGAGAELAPPYTLAGWRAALNAGVNAGLAVRGTTYRAGVTASWQDVLELGGGLVGEPDAVARQWQPVVAGVVRLSRYELGVVREWLPNSFGAVNTIRFGVAF